MRNLNHEWMVIRSHPHYRNQMHSQPIRHFSYTPLPVSVPRRWTKQRYRPMETPKFHPLRQRLTYCAVQNCNQDVQYASNFQRHYNPRRCTETNALVDFTWRYVPISNEVDGPEITSMNPNADLLEVEPTNSSESHIKHDEQVSVSDHSENQMKNVFPFGKPYGEAELPATASLRLLHDHELIHPLIGRDHVEEHPVTVELKVRGWNYNRFLRCWYRQTDKEPMLRGPVHDVCDVVYFEVNNRRQLTGLKLVINFRWVHADFR